MRATWGTDLWYAFDMIPDSLEPRMDPGVRPGLQLFSQSWRALRANADIFILPVASFLVICGVVAFFFAVLVNNHAFAKDMPLSATVVLGIFLFLFLLIFNLSFFKAASIAIIHARMIERRSYSLIDGVGHAAARVVPLAAWAALWACGLTILYLTARWLARFKLLERLLMVSVESLNPLTWFVLPSIIISDNDLQSAVKHSARLFKENWGTTIIAVYSPGIFFSFIYGGVFAVVVGLTMILIPLTENGGSEIYANIVLFLWAAYIPFFTFALIIQSLFMSVVRVALYEYASTKNVSVFDRDLLVGMVKAETALPHHSLT